MDCKQLPIFQFRDEIVQKVKEKQFVLLKGESCCGKSTQVPQYLLQAGFKNVLSVQARRAAAVMLAQRVAQEMNCQVGDEVGFKIRYHRNISSGTKLEFATEATALKDLSKDPGNTKYSCIILDQIDQRSVECDILLALLKKLVTQSHPHLRVVIMSATMDEATFSAYLTASVTVSVPGQLNPVDVRYGDFQSQSDLVATVLQIHHSGEAGDILIFLPNVRQINETVDLLSKQIAHVHTKIVPFYSQLSPEQRELAISSNFSGHRKIICADNSAEGLTIADVVFVIDTGLVSETRNDPSSGRNITVDVFVSKQEAQQRKDTAGRTRAGVCYRLYPEGTFNNMLQFRDPEIVRRDFSRSLLLFLSLDIQNCGLEDLISLPPRESIDAAIKNLFDHQAITSDCRITEKGRILASLPVHEHLASALYQANKLKCLRQVLIIVSMMSLDCEFSWRDNNRIGYHLALLKIYSEWEKDNLDGKLCTRSEKSCSDHLKLIQAKKMHAELQDKLCNMQFDVASEDNCNIVRCFINDRETNIAVKCGLGYRVNKSNEKVQLHSEDALALNAPDFLVFHRTTRTATDTFIEHCSPCEREWLMTSSSDDNNSHPYSWVSRVGRGRF